MKIFWSRKDTPKELHFALAELAGHDVQEGAAAKGGTKVAFEKKAGKKESFSVTPSKDGFLVRYDTIPHALRGLSTIMAGIPANGKAHSEKNSFEMLGLMLDCSRNAVMKPSHFKQWIRQLALLGYNTAMLYTEDTFELDGEPYFGHLRGAYSKSELKEIDEYASKFGIEMIGCIQTLGHMGQMLRWPAYAQVKDTAEVMLVDEKKTYDLIEKMIKNFKSVFKSRRIHIGMDEAHDMGQGRFMDLHGHEGQFSIFSRHLEKVHKMCGKHGMRPMIWSDMYFRMGSKTHDYYDLKAKIPQHAIKSIPKETDIVYWDYYHNEQSFYENFIKMHKKLGKDIMMASGLWSWVCLWYDSGYSEPKVRACVDACAKTGVKELFLTTWGDDGAYCDFDSLMTGFTFAAELSFGKPDGKDMKKRFKAVFNANYDENQAAGDLNKFDKFYYGCSCLWDDPILGIYFNAVDSVGKGSLDKMLAHYEGLAKKLSKTRKTTTSGSLEHAFRLADLIAAKISVRSKLVKAHKKMDVKALVALKKDIKAAEGKINAALESFREMWMAHNKPFGFEVVQKRLAGVRERFSELSVRIDELAKGKADSIPELDNISIPKEKGLHWYYVNHNFLSSGSKIQ